MPLQVNSPSHVYPGATIAFQPNLDSKQTIEESVETIDVWSTDLLPDPMWADALKAQEELTHFQADCKNEGLKQLVDEIVRLKQENLTLSKKEEAFRHLVSKYAKPLLDLVKYSLYDLIQGSPQLQKRLTHYLESYRTEEKQIDFRDVIGQLEREARVKEKPEAQDGWALMGPDQKMTLVSLDIVTLNELKEQIELIQSVMTDTIEDKDFLVNVSTLRKKGRLPKSGAGLDKHYESAINCYSIISGLAFLGRVAQAVSPALKISLQLLFPGNTLTILNILLTILTATSES